MIISHLKIIAFQTITSHSFWKFHIGGKPVAYIINRKIHGCLEIPDLFLVLNMIFLTRSLRSCSFDLVCRVHVHSIMFNTRNRSGISAQPCIILHVLLSYGLQQCRAILVSFTTRNSAAPTTFIRSFGQLLIFGLQCAFTG